MHANQNEVVLKNFLQLQRNDILCDCLIVGKDYKSVNASYPVHTALLAASCTYFCKQFMIQRPEHGNLLVIPSLDFQCIKIGIDYIYGKLPSIALHLDLLEEFAVTLDFKLAYDYARSVRRAQAATSGQPNESGLALGTSKGYINIMPAPPLRRLATDPKSEAQGNMTVLVDTDVIKSLCENSISNQNFDGDVNTLLQSGTKRKRGHDEQRPPKRMFVFKAKIGSDEVLCKKQKTSNTEDYLVKTYQNTRLMRQRRRACNTEGGEMKGDGEEDGVVVVNTQVPGDEISTQVKEELDYEEEESDVIDDDGTMDRHDGSHEDAVEDTVAAQQLDPVPGSSKAERVDVEATADEQKTPTPGDHKQIEQGDAADGGVEDDADGGAQIKHAPDSRDADVAGLSQMIVNAGDDEIDIIISLGGDVGDVIAGVVQESGAAIDAVGSEQPTLVTQVPTPEDKEADTTVSHKASILESCTTEASITANKPAHVKDGETPLGDGRKKNEMDQLPKDEETQEQSDINQEVVPEKTPSNSNADQMSVDAKTYEDGGAIQMQIANGSGEISKLDQGPVDDGSSVETESKNTQVDCVNEVMTVIPVTEGNQENDECSNKTSTVGNETEETISGDQKASEQNKNAYSLKLLSFMDLHLSAQPQMNMPKRKERLLAPKPDPDFAAWKKELGTCTNRGKGKKGSRKKTSWKGVSHTSADPDYSSEIELTRSKRGRKKKTIKQEDDMEEDGTDYATKKFILKATMVESEMTDSPPKSRANNKGLKSEKRLPCPQCGIRYPALIGLKWHLAKDHQIESCMYCAYSPKEDYESILDCRSDVAQHVCQHLLKHPSLVRMIENAESKKTRQETNFLCEVCSCTLKTKEGFLKHKKFCGKTKDDWEATCVFCCNQKTYYGTKKNELLKHMKEKHGDQKFYVCTICGDTFKNELFLSAHFDEKHNIKTTFAHLKYIKAVINRLNIADCIHAVEQHLEAEELKDSTLYDSLFICWSCRAVYTDIQSFTTHIQEHTISTDLEIRPYLRYQYECHYCGEMSKNRKDNTTHVLDAHRDICTEIFSCTECDAAFLNKGCLRDHMQIHASSALHICNICGSQFRFAQAYRTHMTVRHSNGEKKVHCPQCPFSTYNKQTMKSHINRHRAYRPFQCELCDKNYTCRTQLQTHQKAKHPGELIHAINIDDSTAADSDI